MQGSFEAGFGGIYSARLDRRFDFFWLLRGGGFFSRCRHHDPDGRGFGFNLASPLAKIGGACGVLVGPDLGSHSSAGALFNQRFGEGLGLAGCGLGSGGGDATGLWLSSLAVSGLGLIGSSLGRNQFGGFAAGHLLGRFLCPGLQ